MARFDRRRSGGGFKAFFVGSVVGGIIGTTASLLFAPKEGQKLRKDLSKKCKKMSCKAQDLAYDARDKCADMLDDVKELAQTTKKKILRK